MRLVPCVSDLSPQGRVNEMSTDLRYAVLQTGPDPAWLPGASMAGHKIAGLQCDPCAEPDETNHIVPRLVPKLAAPHSA